MPTPVARLVGSVAATLTTTDSGPSPTRRTRWFWLIWPVPMRSVSNDSTRPPTASLSHAGLRSSIWRTTSTFSASSQAPHAPSAARSARTRTMTDRRARRRVVGMAGVLGAGALLSRLSVPGRLLDGPSFAEVDVVARRRRRDEDRHEDGQRAASLARGPRRLELLLLQRRARAV